MAEDWSPAEVAATVADYLTMLAHELRGEPYTKKEHNRRLQSLLNGRSAGAIEFKRQNISAVMIELGFPYVDGYKPRRNYQELPRTEVLAQLSGDAEVERITEAVVEKPVPVPDPSAIDADVFVAPPVRDVPPTPYERRTAPRPPTRINYLEREARNRSLGLAGELFVMQAEHRRLWEAGARHLAGRIDHVSATKGDGLGYDILSFENDGRERFIEVTTTAFGSMTPFFASAKEVEVSEALPTFHLYRVFKFRKRRRSSRYLVLSGSHVFSTRRSSERLSLEAQRTLKPTSDCQGCESCGRASHPLARSSTQAVGIDAHLLGIVPRHSFSLWSSPPSTTAA